MVTTQLLTPHCRTLRGSVLWCHDNPMREKTCIRRRRARISLIVKHVTLREDKDRRRTGSWVERWLMTFGCKATELFGAAILWKNYPDTCGAHGAGENRDCRFLIIFCVSDIPSFISFTQQTLYLRFCCYCRCWWINSISLSWCDTSTHMEISRLQLRSVLQRKTIAHCLMWEVSITKSWGSWDTFQKRSHSSWILGTEHNLVRLREQHKQRPWGWREHKPRGYILLPLLYTGSNRDIERLGNSLRLCRT